MERSDQAHAVSVGAVYFGYFAALAVAGPFLALYLERHGYRANETAYVLALLPTVRILATPGWTLFADRLQSASTVLRITALGAMLSFACLLAPLSRVALIVALVAFTAFRSPATSLIDVLALRSSARTGGDFGRLRAWGTIGFMVATLALGFVVRAEGSQWIVHAAVLSLGFTTLATFGLPRASPPAAVNLFGALSVLVRRRRFVLFLATCALHQVGLASYDGLFVAHVTALSDAAHAGIAVAFGACFEVAFLLVARRALLTLGLERALVLAYTASAVRWALCAFVTDAWVLILIQALHAFTFGAFYTAGVALVDRESPPEVRASAQGIFGAFTWGVASTASLLLAGTLLSHGGMRTVFLVAAVASVFAAVLAGALPRAITNSDPLAR